MQKPGFKVMHMEDVDQRSNCQPFTACLEQVREWSNRHPRHLPLFILVETKTDKPIPAIPGAPPLESGTPRGIAPLSGADTERLLAAHGFRAEEIVGLKARGVVAVPGGGT